MFIRTYEDSDEESWVRCRVLSFLNTAYYDNVLQKKEMYNHPAIELVAVIDGQVVGLIDIEYENEPGTVCTAHDERGGMIWHIAVHPDYQRNGIGERLLEAAVKKARDNYLSYLEAWTRDDAWVQNWYRKMEFQEMSSYYHLYFEGKETEHLRHNNPAVNPVSVFAHYTGDDIESFKTLQRKHKCVCYVRNI
ncbi:GNAT family N-acetyltransferase [Corticicoccus populi]|uniref:GNAT family N-acetyltransferase n=1 Tax=Corticicoccus populi TaxID=1812821 RepID=A0ABW5WWH3_9STAP